jgi:hypothetical protein
MAFVSSTGLVVLQAGDPLPEVSRHPARAVTRGKGLQPDPEVGVLMSG